MVMILMGLPYGSFDCLLQCKIVERCYCNCEGVRIRKSGKDFSVKVLLGNPKEKLWSDVCLSDVCLMSVESKL